MFGYVVLEDVIWAVLFVYFTVMIYEFLSNKSRIDTIWHPRMKFLVGSSWTMLIVFILGQTTIPHAFHVPNFYLWWGLVLLFAPSIFEFNRRPRLILKFLVVICYFIFLVLFMN